MKLDYPLLFESNWHPALWGGESWEISAHEAGPGVVANGPLKGVSLRELLPDFPLLFKVIDAKTRLSVQVHPNERTRLVTGGDPKTEMWCLLNDGCIFAGLREGVKSDEVEAAVKSGRFEELLVRHDAKAGDVFFIPGGLVHAIGDGTRLYEVQQNSNTTFRLYDWGRVGADGKPRQLHVAESLQAIDYALGAPKAETSACCPFFSFRAVDVAGSLALPARTDSFTALYAARGSAAVNGVALAEGASMLVPAGLDMSIEPNGSARLFVTTK